MMFRGDVRFESWCHLRVTAHCCLPACCTPSPPASWHRVQARRPVPAAAAAGCRLLAAAAAAAASAAAAATHPGASISQSV